MEQISAHLAGDYLLQSRWMATEKVNRWWPAILHAFTYTLPFGLITTDARALAVIGVTHLLIDRYRLVKRIMWLRDRLAPRSGWSNWESFKGGYGGEPEYLYFWLMVIIDNTTHILINYIALANWG